MKNIELFTLYFYYKILQSINDSMSICIWNISFYIGIDILNKLKGPCTRFEVEHMSYK